MSSKCTFTLAVVCLLANPLCAQKPEETTGCNAVTLTLSLKAGESYKQRINDLTFNFNPWMDKSSNSIWRFSLEDADGHDYIYPVNPPIRFNPSQYLGRGYGESARQSLSTHRELRFLLNKKDYAHLWPFVTNALWPYSAPRPDSAADEYVTELGKMRTGLLRLKISKFDVSPDDVVHSAEFQAEFVAPADFRFDQKLKPKSTACPPPTSP